MKKIYEQFGNAIKTYLVILLLFFTLVFQYKHSDSEGTQNHCKCLKPFPLQSGNLKIGGKRVLDKNGILMINYGEQRGKIYNPVSISQYANSLYYLYCSSLNNSYRKKFLKQAQWLIENQVAKDNMGVWYYKFRNNAFGAKPPWISAMAQGLALSVLSEAYCMTRNLNFLEKAKLALNAFTKSVQDGGVVSHWPNGDLWFEEVAKPRGK